MSAIVNYQLKVLYSVKCSVILYTVYVEYLKDVNLQVSDVDLFMIFTYDSKSSSCYIKYLNFLNHFYPQFVMSTISEVLGISPHYVVCVFIWFLHVI